MKPCPACNSVNQSVSELIPGRLDVIHCSRCGLRQSRILRQGNAGYEVFPDDRYERSLGVVRRQQSGSIVQAVRDLHPSAKRWLDVGCGTGLVIQRAQQAGFQVFGVDPDPKAIQHAAEAVGAKNVRLELMTEKSVPDASQDVITTLDLLEHIPAKEVDAFLDLLYTKLKSKGVYVVKVPSSEGLYAGLAHFLREQFGVYFNQLLARLWLIEYAFPHTFYFQERSLRLLLEKHGFEVVECRYLQEIPNYTIRDRIRLDGAISPLVATLILPIFVGINWFETLRGKTDSMLMIARKR